MTYLSTIKRASAITAVGNEGATAFITDAATLGSSALTVIDLATGEKLRRPSVIPA